MTKVDSIDAYIAGFPLEVQQILTQIRALIQSVVPEATEAISYGMPTFKLKGNLVHFAAFKHHIGFYATPTGHEAFKADLSKYKQGKGSVQFPLDQPIPFDLITRIVAYRRQEVMKKK